jgi:hypothetical protein
MEGITIIVFAVVLIWATLAVAGLGSRIAIMLAQLHAPPRRSQQG